MPAPPKPDTKGNPQYQLHRVHRPLSEQQAPSRRSRLWARIARLLSRRG